MCHYENVWNIAIILIVDTCNLWVTCVEQLFSQKKKFFFGLQCSDENPFDVPLDVIASTCPPPPPPSLHDVLTKINTKIKNPDLKIAKIDL